MTVVAADFRQLMTAFPSGVAVVTAFDEHGHPWGMTCSSLCSVAVTPPTLLVCLRRGGPTLGAVLRQAMFTVNLLHHGARATAELFASGDPHRFDRVPWRLPPGRGGPRLIRTTHAVADCVVAGSHEVGDHTVVFGRVLRAEHHGALSPLLYGLRRYAAWPREEDG